MKNLVLVAVVSFSISTFAKAPYATQVKTAVPNAKNVSCVTCHSALPALNQFGKDYQELVVNTGFSQEGFAKLMDMDSDQDTLTNYVELLQGTKPGVKGE